MSPAKKQNEDTEYFRAYEVWELERSSPPPKRRPV